MPAANYAEIQGWKRPGSSMKGSPGFKRETKVNKCLVIHSAVWGVGVAVVLQMKTQI